MKYFLDTEFVEDFNKPLFGKKRHYIDLISIGIVAEDGREYYAISKDFDVKAVWDKWQYSRGQGDRNNVDPREYWLRDNVLAPIYAYLAGEPENLIHEEYDWFTLRNMEKLIKKYGKSNKQIAEEVKEFCTSVKRREFTRMDGGLGVVDEIDQVEFYGYYSDYDWVLLCSLFGKMIDLPQYFPMYCNDLKQTLDEKAQNLLSVGAGTHTTGDKRYPENFDEAIRWIKCSDDYPNQLGGHDALEDARWNRKLYEALKKNDFKYAA